jgi:hypothetical protein
MNHNYVIRQKDRFPVALPGKKGRDSDEGLGRTTEKLGPSLFHTVQEPGAHPAFYTMGFRGCFPGGKAEGT